MNVLLSRQIDNTSFLPERKEPTVVNATHFPQSEKKDETDQPNLRFGSRKSDIRLARTKRIEARSTNRCFRNAFADSQIPIIYGEIFRYAMSERESDRACMNVVKKAVIDILISSGISAKVTNRMKSIYSIYVKMRTNGCSVQEVMDKIGIRIIVNCVPDCYRVLGLLHTHFRPIPGTFDDYIANPKNNGYQSLHTCVYALKQLSHKPIEIQVRTALMHRKAETGTASHWRYKNGTETQIDLSEYFSDGDNLITAQGRQIRTEPFIEKLEDTPLDNIVFANQITRI